MRAIYFGPKKRSLTILYHLMCR